MENKGTPRPTSEEGLYGQEMKAIGYERGYLKSTYDTRRRKAVKEKSLYRRFGQYLEHLDDILWQNRRR